MSNLQITVTPRFTKVMEKAAGHFKARVYRKVHRFVTLHREDPVTVAGEYKVFKSVEPHIVLEIPLSDGDRLLGHWSKHTLTLVDAGPHDVYDLFTMDVLESQLPAAAPADQNFWPESCRARRLFETHVDNAYEEYPDENDPRWISTLADEQCGIVTTAFRQIRRASRTQPRSYAIVGGPGTGKTSILVKLLVDLAEVGRKPALVVSDAVANYINGCGLNIDNDRIDKHELWSEETGSRFESVLFDDPASFHEIEQAFYLAGNPFRAIVVAFDPCQLEEDFSDTDFKALQQLVDFRPFVLSECYRQKERVGRAAKRVFDMIADSTPFKADDKISAFKESHDLVHRVSNDLTFPNKYGTEALIENATLSDFRQAVSRLKRHPLWTHARPLLLVTQEGIDVDDWDFAYELRGIAYQQIVIQCDGLTDLAEVKGIEYQHAFMVLGRRLFHELSEGFEGTGKKVYARRRLLRIPFSRAKDSIVTFVVDDNTADDA